MKGLVVFFLLFSPYLYGAKSSYPLDEVFPDLRDKESLNEEQDFRELLHGLS